MIWFLIFGLCAAVFAYIGTPLYFRSLPEEDVAAAQDNEINAYRLELQNIEAALVAGTGDATALTLQKSVLEKRLVSSAVQTPHLSTQLKPAWAVGTLAVLIAGTFGIYTLIGSPELTTTKSLNPTTQTVAQPSPGPTREDMDAAAQMSTADRAAMIQGMVDGLAAKLAENPDDTEGWVRLLRARGVLGQTTEAQAEIVSMSTHYSNEPEVISQILIKSGWAE